LSPFFKGGIFPVAFKPLFGKEGKGEIFSGICQESCGGLLGHHTSGVQQCNRRSTPMLFSIGNDLERAAGFGCGAPQRRAVSI